jgi:hypothetical protein
MTMAWTVLGMRRSTVLELLFAAEVLMTPYPTTHRAR